MSEILCYLSQLDVTAMPNSGHSSASDRRPRLSALVFVVRQWAKSVGIPCTMPGVAFSNFMLTILVVFFLQTRRPPMLPALRCLEPASSGVDV